ncbi:MarR family winged helix-turn-helix transcriptional regulator [Gordonia sp. NPDC003950]
MALRIDERLGFDIKAAEVALMSAKSDGLRHLGLTVAQYAALLTLREHPGISGAGLARACLVTPQASAATLKTLEGKGLVERARDDWSRNTLTSRLTDEGTKLLAKADKVAVGVEQRVFDALTAQERQTLRRLLAACRSAASET